MLPRLTDSKFFGMVERFKSRECNVRPERVYGLSHLAVDPNVQSRTTIEECVSDKTKSKPGSHKDKPDASKTVHAQAPMLKR